MEIVLVPGFWLDASSWADVTVPLVAAGHRVFPLTLPGLESVQADRSGIGLQDHIDAVIEVVDDLRGPIVLVGHSGGGAVIHGVVDARPERITRAVYVDSAPLPEGDSINTALPADGDDIPLPPWDDFSAADVVDLSPSLRNMFRERAVPQPRGVAYDAQRLHDERRFSVPATVIACEFTSADLAGWIADDVPDVAELARLTDLEVVDLPTGHWPQFTRPAELGAAILAAVDRSTTD